MYWPAFTVDLLTQNVLVHIGCGGVMSYGCGSEGVTGGGGKKAERTLLAEVRRRLRLKHYRLRAEQAYLV